MNKTKIFTLIALSVSSTFFSFKVAEVYLTRTGKITFFSTTPIENIEANNNQVSSSLNTKTGDLAFVVLMKSFEFAKAKMQEDFNSDYLETDKFPKATFKGKITNLTAINFGRDGSYSGNVTGTLNIHGVDKAVTTTATFNVKGAVINAKSNIKVALKDFNISGPSIANNKVASTIDVKIDMTYNPK